MSGVGGIMKHLGDYTKCVGENWKMTLGCVVALTIVLGVSYYWFVIRKRQLESFEYNINREPSDTSDSSKNAELMLFYADWCPACKKAKPEWDEVRAEYEGKSVNGYAIIFKEIDCTSETEDTERMLEKYSVSGYPTLKLLKDGNVIEYDARVSKENVTEFLNTML